MVFFLNMPSRVTFMAASVQYGKEILFTNAEPFFIVYPHENECVHYYAQEYCLVI